MLVWLLVWLGTVVLNLIPAFMPPTWTLLAYVHLAHDLPIVPLAFVGAIGAVAGRALLAVASREFGARFLSPARQEHLLALGETLRRRKLLGFSGLGLFAIGPIPSNHLFIAAGLARLPLAPILLVFGIARFVSYVLWVAAADTAATSLRDAVAPELGGGAGLAIQVAAFVLLILVVRLDWARLLGRWLADQDAAAADSSRPAQPSSDRAACPPASFVGGDAIGGVRESDGPREALRAE